MPQSRSGLVRFSYRGDAIGQGHRGKYKPPQGATESQLHSQQPLQFLAIIVTSNEINAITARKIFQDLPEAKSDIERYGLADTSNRQDDRVMPAFQVKLDGYLAFSITVNCTIIDVRTRLHCACLDIVFIKNMFGNGIRRPVIPGGIVIMLQFDGHNRATADIRTTPTTSPGIKLRTNLKLGFLHEMSVSGTQAGGLIAR